MKSPREVRVQQIPSHFDGKKWHTEPRAIVMLGTVGNWAMVRRADSPNAMPLIISHKEWLKLPIQTDEPEQSS
jgi:hypothetical protein